MSATGSVNEPGWVQECYDLMGDEPTQESCMRANALAQQRLAESFLEAAADLGRILAEGQERRVLDRLAGPRCDKPTVVESKGK
jgi:hypothetical protein